MKDIKNIIPKSNEFIEPITDSLWFCKECQSKEQCNQSVQGWYEWEGKLVRCRFNKRGYYNDKLIEYDKYKEFSADNFDEIKEAVNKYHNLYLYGEQGLGKTHFLYWLANHYNEKGHNVFIAKWSEINQMIKEELKEDLQDPLRIRLKKIELLFIDDLGNETMTPQSAEVLSTVIDHRYLKNKPTFITSNYDLDGLGNHYYTTKLYGQPLMPYHLARQLISRLNDVNKFPAIKIKNKNWRKELEYKE